MINKVTINDIAKALNITASTVSRALSGNDRINPETRTAVEQKAEELGYKRNIIASSLRRGSTDIVGMVVPRINRHFFSNIISGAEAILNPAGFNLVVCQSHDRKEDERRAIASLMKNQVAGIMISHSIETKSSDSFDEMGLEDTILIQFDRTFDTLPGVQVINDNYSGAYLATSHLIKAGYKRIGHLAGDAISNVYVDRLNGYRTALSDHNMPVDESIIYLDSITRDKGFYNMAQALEHKCDALYCAGDYAALGVIEYARHNNIGIPDDFGVVGTANEEFADLVSPSLTTLEQNAFDIGNQVARAFLDIHQGKTIEENKIVVPMRLITRQSSQKKL